MYNLYNFIKIIYRKSISTSIDFQQSENTIDSQSNNSNVSTTVADDTTEDTFQGKLLDLCVGILLKGPCKRF